MLLCSQTLFMVIWFATCIYCSSNYSISHRHNILLTICRCNKIRIGNHWKTPSPQISTIFKKTAQPKKKTFKKWKRYIRINYGSVLYTKMKGPLVLFLDVLSLPLNVHFCFVLFLNSDSRTLPISVVCWILFVVFFFTNLPRPPF